MRRPRAVAGPRGTAPGPSTAPAERGQAEAQGSEAACHSTRCHSTTRAHSRCSAVLPANVTTVPRGTQLTAPRIVSLPPRGGHACSVRAAPAPCAGAGRCGHVCADPCSLRRCRAPWALGSWRVFRRADPGRVERRSTCSDFSTIRSTPSYPRSPGARRQPLPVTFVGTWCGFSTRRVLTALRVETAREAEPRLTCQRWARLLALSVGGRTRV